MWRVQLFSRNLCTSREVNSNETNQVGVADVIASRSHDKLKTLYSHCHSAYGHPTWQDRD